MKDIKTFYTINSFNQGPRVEEIYITETTIENGKIYFDGTGEDGRWVGFSEDAVGQEFFVNLNEVAKRYSEILMCDRQPQKPKNPQVPYDYFNETMNVGE